MRQPRHNKKCHLKEQKFSKVYIDASAGTGTTGTAKTDQNAYTLTLSADTDSYPFEIDPTKIDTIIAGA